MFITKRLIKIDRIGFVRLFDMKLWSLLAVLLLALAACTTPEVTNVPTAFYAHNLSAKIIPVLFKEKVERSEDDPARYIYTVQKNILHEGDLIIPKGSDFSSTQYYRDSPYLVVDFVRLSGNLTWTPAQGVITRTVGNEGFATISHITVPR